MLLCLFGIMSVSCSLLGQMKTLFITIMILKLLHTFRKPLTI